MMSFSVFSNTSCNCPTCFTTETSSKINYLLSVTWNNSFYWIFICAMCFLLYTTSWRSDWSMMPVSCYYYLYLFCTFWIVCWKYYTVNRFCCGFVFERSVLGFLFYWQLHLRQMSYFAFVPRPFHPTRIFIPPTRFIFKGLNKYWQALHVACCNLSCSVQISYFHQAPSRSLIMLSFYSFVLFILSVFSPTFVTNLYTVKVYSSCFCICTFGWLNL